MDVALDKTKIQDITWIRQFYTHAHTHTRIHIQRHTHIHTTARAYSQYLLVACVACLGKSGGVTILTEYLLLFKHKGCVLESFVAPSACEMFWMPYSSHGTGKRSPVCVCVCVCVF